MPSQPIPFEKYLNIRSAYSPAFDPLSGKVAYLSDASGVPQVWAIDPSGGEPSQLTSFSDRVGSIDLSPDGKHLLFTMDNAGDERHQLYLIENESSRVIPLTQNPKIMHVYGVWSPDSKAISYASNERNRAFFDIYTRDVPDGKPRRVFEHDGSNSVAAWSPDGRYLVISQSRTQLYNDLILLDLQTGGTRLLTSPDELAAYSAVQWAADG
ncbi:MAG: S9 family peptidase, partial [Chloroflexi bacterium]|nr:S9 family peptidase [Chloroflexota bacterium]